MKDFYLRIKSLHTFRDSPFNTIDTNRIFADYIEWAIYTFSSIVQSKERWSIRVHPSSVFWEKILLYLLKIFSQN